MVFSQGGSSPNDIVTGHDDATPHQRVIFSFDLPFVLEALVVRSLNAT
jgi:hypothetical protein